MKSVQMNNSVKGIPCTVTNDFRDRGVFTGKLLKTNEKMAAFIRGGTKKKNTPTTSLVTHYNTKHQTALTEYQTFSVTISQLTASKRRRSQ